MLNFKRPGGTSRGVLTQKETFFLFLKSADKIGVGECGLFRGLSCDDRPDYEEKLSWLCRHINNDPKQLFEELLEFPSIQFGLEQALLSLEANNDFDLFPSDFSKGRAAISINGLIWMGDPSFMKSQIKDKLNDGFRTLKMKIGAIDFDNELEILSSIRKQYNSSELELRVDANGAFSSAEALDKLKQLALLDIHSIEQPIKAGQLEEMSALCKESPLPIALDEELIGVFTKEDKKELLLKTKPQYIILKPSLVGGIKGSKEWINLCTENDIGWWITSALESNIGLNAIAQYTYTLNNQMPQGLGTGSLFTNNIKSPMFVKAGALHMDSDEKWDDLGFLINE